MANASENPSDETLAENIRLRSAYSNNNRKVNNLGYKYNLTPEQPYRDQVV